MRTVVPLTEIKVRSAKPGAKHYAIFDGGGLYLWVKTNGTKLWFFKYQFEGKARLLSFGVYPEVSLTSARVQRAESRKQLAEGVDPKAFRESLKTGEKERAVNTFEWIARQWFETKTADMVPGHRKRIIDRLQKDIFPWLGERPVAEVTPMEVLTVIQRIVGRTAVESARRALGDVSRVFRYSVATGRCASDPTRDLRGALPTPKEEHFAAITDPEVFGPLLRAIDGYHGSFVVTSALKLAPLLVVRPGELRQMEWENIIFDEAEWRFLVTKTKVLHIVPLPTQAIDILRALRPLTGNGRFVFPNPRTPDGSRPLSENAVLAALRNLGYQKGEVTGHGFRATFRTIGAEKLGFRVDLLEHQLAHAVRDPLGRAYNRTEYLPERREMMQKWADYLDALKRGINSTELRGVGHVRKAGN